LGIAAAALTACGGNDVEIVTLNRGVNKVTFQTETIVALKLADEFTPTSSFIETVDLLDGEGNVRLHKYGLPESHGPGWTLKVTPGETYHVHVRTPEGDISSPDWETIRTNDNDNGEPLTLLLESEAASSCFSYGVTFFIVINAFLFCFGAGVWGYKGYSG